MAKKSNSKPSPAPSKSRVAATRALSLFDLALPVLGGAVAVMLVLSFLKFGAAEVWAPFGISGGKILRALALSGLAGGITTAILGKRYDGPLAAMACSLGWALWGWSLHFAAQGRYFNYLPGGMTRVDAGGLIFSNAVSQSLCIAFGLLLASGVSWFWVRRSKGAMPQPDNVSDDDREGNGLASFGTALVYPLSTLLGGVIMMNICALLALPLGDPSVEQLPSEPGIALWCGLLTMLALLVATFVARRTFRVVGSVGDVAIAPLVIAFVAMLGRIFTLVPAALLIWHTSAFEMASWAALGAALGFYFARKSACP